jgi:hypothetical protein
VRPRPDCHPHPGRDGGPAMAHRDGI